MLFVNAVLGVILFIPRLIFSGGSALASDDFIAPIVNVIIGVNLWQMKANWQKYTVWWAVLGLVIFGIAAIASGNFFSLITQIGFSGSLILLLAGTPTKARTIAATAVFLIMYLGMICLLLALQSLIVY